MKESGGLSSTLDWTFRILDLLASNNFFSVQFSCCVRNSDFHPLVGRVKFQALSVLKNAKHSV